MAEKEFLLGVKARELLKHTKRETRVVTDDINPQDVRTILHKIAALEDIRDAREVCSQAINAIDRKKKEGFSKSTFRLYGEDMRQIANPFRRTRRQQYPFPHRVRQPPPQD